MSEWQQRSPKCRRVRHDWTGKATLSHDADGVTTQQKCRVCGATRREFGSNNRFHGSKISYLPGGGVHAESV